MNAKKLIALLLAVVMTIGLVACGGNSDAETTAPAATDGETQPTETTGGATAQGEYTYHEALSAMPTNWNVHTYQTTDDAYPQDFLMSGLYTFIYNDELNPVEGKEPYAGYKIIPEMAADFPVDVTEKVKAEHPEFGIPESATSGFAYTIDLNPNAVWENGKPINADTYVESMKRLLDPKMMNYRATDRYDGDFVLAGAENYANQGHTKPLTMGKAQAYLGVDNLQAVVDAYGDAKGFINWANSFGVQYDFANFPWEAGQPVDPAGFCLEATEEPVETPLSIRDLCEFFVNANVATGNADAETATAWVPDEIFVNYEYASDVSYDTVGLYKTGDYQITLVLKQSLAGFNLLYNLGSNWIVEPELYDSCIKESNGVYTSNYCTSVETTLSYGPYKLVNYQTDKAMRFERNENWYGYSDGKHVYVDPTDGQTYPMYMTTAIDAQKVAEASTQKLMFLKGELATYGLQADDFASYRNSDYAHAVPQETLFFLILNGHQGSIEKREAAADFDKENVDLQTMTLMNFRKAIAVTYDKELFAATISPARSGGYGIVGTPYIYDPETGARYRDTDQAKKVLCDFYSVDVSKYASLDEAVDSITGFDPETAKTLYTEAFKEALELGYITDNNNDGISDQTVTIEYCLSVDNDFMSKTIDYLNEKMNEVTVGTPFENRVKFVKSAPYGNEWTSKIRSGMSDTVLGGWSGALLNPFGLTRLYTSPALAYDAAWFDANSVKLTLNVPVDGVDTDVTMSLLSWSEALNGTTVKMDDKEYNFGEGMADIETRLDILAGIEGEVLKTYDYIPMLQNAGMHLLSQQMYYVVDDYNPVMGRGGITYLKYNYDDAEWAAFVKEQGGELSY